jgi:hypothetical protein
MTKYRCTLSSGSYLYHATVIAGSEQQAKEMAAVEADKKWSGYGLGRAKWNVAVVTSSVSGPARVLECSYHSK